MVPRVTATTIVALETRIFPKVDSPPTEHNILPLVNVQIVLQKRLCHARKRATNNISKPFIAYNACPQRAVVQQSILVGVS